MTALAWLSTILVLGGTLAVSVKIPAGWVVRLAGSCGWARWAMYESNWPLLAVNLAFALIDCNGALCYGAEDDNDSRR